MSIELELLPIMKARKSVSEVIVMADPALNMASPILSCKLLPYDIINSLLLKIIKLIYNRESSQHSLSQSYIKLLPSDVISNYTSLLFLKGSLKINL